MAKVSPYNIKVRKDATGYFVDHPNGKKINHDVPFKTKEEAMESARLLQLSVGDRARIIDLTKE